jgi:hypothetical protein
MLQAGKLWDRFPMRSLIYFSAPNPSSRNMGPELSQPVRETSNGICLGVKRGQSVRLITNRHL